MNDHENARAQAEALKSAPTRSSADRALFWAGLNRYLETEVRHARKTARKATSSHAAKDADE